MGQGASTLQLRNQQQAQCHPDGSGQSAAVRCRQPSPCVASCLNLFVRFLALYTNSLLREDRRRFLEEFLSMAVVPCVQALRSVWLQPAQRQQVCDRHVGSGTARWHRHLRCTASADHAEGAAETSGSSSAIHKPAARHWQRVEGSATASGTASGGTLDRQIRRASTSDLEQLCILEQLTAEEGSTWSCRQVEVSVAVNYRGALLARTGSLKRPLTSRNQATSLSCR